MHRRIWQLESTEEWSRLEYLYSNHWFMHSVNKVVIISRQYIYLNLLYNGRCSGVLCILCCDNKKPVGKTITQLRTCPVLISAVPHIMCRMLYIGHLKCHTNQCDILCQGPVFPVYWLIAFLNSDLSPGDYFRNNIA